MIVVVDTHALTRYVEDYRKPGPASRAIFDDAASTLLVPTIALAEARFMIFRNKVQIIWEQITSTIEGDDRLVPIPLTLEILNRVPSTLEMHDGIIVATALMVAESLGEDVSLITRDKEIRDSGLVQTVW
jgi:PIN domain nuclease of toxin-antitoxin system